MAEFHLAQANIALARTRLTSPRMRSFVEQIDEINAVADDWPGFVWRFESNDGDALSLRLFGNRRTVVNMSVWESVEALFDYVYRSEHLRVFRDRKQWFRPLDGPHAVLWWIPAGTIPAPAEIPRRLQLLERDGPSLEAFSLRHLFTADGQPRPIPGREKEPGPEA